jgi:hypothetical protein
LADQNQRTIFFDFRRLVVYLYVGIFVWRWSQCFHFEASASIQYSPLINFRLLIL